MLAYSFNVTTSLHSDLHMLRRMSSALKYYDIGFNLTDPMYQGVYNGKKYHEADIPHVLARASQAHVQTMLLTGSSLEESRAAIQIANTYHTPQARLYYTLGVHPCCVNEFVLDGADSTISNPTNDPHFNEQLDITDLSFTIGRLHALYTLIKDNAKDPKFRAIGEMGLDYDRFYYSSQKMQLTFFEEQLKISCLFPEVPLFLHMRNCCEDYVAILRKFVKGFTAVSYTHLDVYKRQPSALRPLLCKISTNQGLLLPCSSRRTTKMAQKYLFLAQTGAYETTVWVVRP